MKNLIFCLLVLSSSLIFGQENKDLRDNKNRAGDHENDPRLFHYDVGFYWLDLNLTNNSLNISGNTKIYLNLLPEYANQLVFDFKNNMTVDSVKINDIIVSFIHSNDLIIIDYIHQFDFNEDYNVVAQIFYHGTPSDGLFYRTNWYDVGIYEFVYSLTEPYSAKYWFPCKQVVSDKADSSYVYVTVPQNLKVGSNGLLKAEYNIGGGFKRMLWESSYPIAYYLISVAVGKYQDYSFNVYVPSYDTNIFVQNYIPDNSQYLSSNQWNINRTSEMLIMLSEKWGLYPHAGEKYGHCIVPLNGGMEHQTMTTLGNFDFRLVIHELSHSWFGDFVTCANWQDIWINEGFASYGEYLGEEFIQPEGYEDGWLEECQNLAKQRPQGSVYVPFWSLNDVGRIFDYRLTYKKGACLVHMIRYIINDDDVFFSALREFLQIYGNSNATGEDLKHVLENYTGIDLNDFFTQWYYGEGYPLYEVTWGQAGNSLLINMSQSTTAEVTPLFTIPMDFKIVYEDNSFEIIRKSVDNNLMNYEIPVSQNVVDVIPNPRKAVLADITIGQDSDMFLTNRNKMFIYPNPANEFLHLRFSDEDANLIEIYDGNGQIAKRIKSEFNTINISDLDQGIYLVKVYFSNSVVNEKLTVIK
ncbi:MAG TPA: M1 family aminopeptidase [Bacteroidales bacterium]|jgi:aminopeptidase N|nr:M1 family aminopeptidase [Bacteroidales bacterium]HOL98333.1 M1 family aminopeptidase [Bacteroidales bacterium]HOM35729.1 M1 family aminopeptidase [Bacteroidales bacterium]HPD23131.1 M1 family aminopeptidase [Bacteroidales bacterium]HRS99060.1 M1 family aminopeptidase [Bacteroidales bacterium]